MTLSRGLLDKLNAALMIGASQTALVARRADKELRSCGQGTPMLQPVCSAWHSG